MFYVKSLLKTCSAALHFNAYSILLKRWLHYPNYSFSQSQIKMRKKPRPKTWKNKTKIDYLSVDQQRSEVKMLEEWTYCRSIETLLLIRRHLWIQFKNDNARSCIAVFYLRCEILLGKVLISLLMYLKCVIASVFDSRI